MLRTLLDADYKTINNKAVIRLFYKTEENKREIEEITDFEPYFYATATEKEKLDDLIREIKKLDNGVVKVEKEKKIELCDEIEVLKITVKEPKDVPELRREVKSLDFCREVREAAMPFTERYIINSGLVPMNYSDKIEINVASFDLEVYNPKGDPRPKEDPLLMISYADSKGLNKVWTFDKPSSFGLDYVEILNNEGEVIRKFIETVKSQGIDILVTYNGDNFDFPYLRERADKHKIKLNLGIDDSPVKMERRGMNNGARVKGRPHIDLYPICRQVFNISRYTLEDVYLELFGEEKPDIKANLMYKIWDEGCDDEIKELFQYSMSDAIGTLKIANSILPLQYEISRTTRDLIYESSRSGSGQKVETLLVRKAYEKNILIPNKPSDRIAEERLKKSYTGAFVVDPKRGIHDSIVLFDFRSLYPSIVISHNIDPSSIDCNCKICKSEKTPTGHHFCKNKKGFIPETLESIIDKRIKVKKKLKEETDENKKKLYDTEQYALKILANSMYGYYAFPRARWYSRDCAETIAALGRDYIHKTIKEAEKSGFEVVYGDTDSVYITRPNETNKEKIMSEANSFLKKINDELPGSMELEFEGFYPRGIFITKKRYALLDEKGALTIKGLETRRRDWSNVAKETQEKVLNALLHNKDPEGAAEIVKKIINRIKEGNVTLKDLAINTQITRNLADYVVSGPHINAAKKAMKKGFEYKQGNMVTYIVTKTGSSISEKAKVIDFVKEGDYDADYYVNNQVLPAVLRILESLGYSADELKGLGKQMTLGNY